MCEEEVIVRRGLAKKHAAVDYKVWQWKNNKEQSACRVTKAEVQTYALEAYRQSGILNFKASDGWYRRWRARWQQPNIVRTKNMEIKEEIIVVNEICDNNVRSDDGQLNLTIPEQKSETPITSCQKINRRFPDLAKKTVPTEEHNLVCDTTISCTSETADSQHECADVALQKHLRSTKTSHSNKAHCKADSEDDIFRKGIESKDIHNGKILEEKLVSSYFQCNKETTDSAGPSNIDIALCEAADILDPQLVVQSTEIKRTSDEPEISPCQSGIDEASYPINTRTLDDLDFGEHELFCDLCEDFHPRNALCCKRNTVAVDNFLLSCVFEKKDLVLLNKSVPNTDDKTEKQVQKKAVTTVQSKNVRVSNPNTVLPKGKRYLMQFKSKVVNYALNHNIKQACVKFKVNRGTVTEWLAERKRLAGNGPPKPFNQCSESGDSEFLSWLESSKFNLTNELIKQKTSEWLLNDKNDKSSTWLRMYAHRLNGTADSSITKRYIMYPELFKRAAVFHAQTHSNLAASRVFGVARRRIIEWQEQSSNKKQKTSSSNVTDQVVDKQILEWYCTQQPIPASKQVKSKALELYRAAGYTEIQCKAQWYYRWRARHKLLPSRTQLYSDTRLLVWALTRLDNNEHVTHAALAAQAKHLGHTEVSRGWTFRFCKKHYKLLQTLPQPDTCLPMVLQQQLTNFRETLQDTLKTHHYSASNIIAMDEVPLHFLPKDENKKPLLVRSPGFQSCQASLIISCLADGTMLPSMFVFKGSEPDCPTDPRVIAAVSEAGLVTNDVMTKWLSLVCLKYLSGGGVVVMDCYESHTGPDVKQILAESNIQHLVIPGGCGFKLLPLFSICRLYKTMIEEMCQEAINNQASALQSPSASQLYQWAVRTHKHLAKVQKDNIRAAFNERLLPPPS